MIIARLLYCSQGWTCSAVGAQLDNRPMEDAHFGREPPKQQLPCHRAALLLGGGQSQQALPPGKPAVALCSVLATAGIQMAASQRLQPGDKSRQMDRLTDKPGRPNTVPNADKHVKQVRILMQRRADALSDWLYQHPGLLTQGHKPL